MTVGLRKAGMTSDAVESVPITSDGVDVPVVRAISLLGLVLPSVGSLTNAGLRQLFNSTSGSVVRSLAGSSVQVSFTLRNAQLYAYWFV